MNAAQFIDEQFHKIIDELHPLFAPISDENLLEKNEREAVFSRDFLHQNGKKFRMEWIVSDYFDPKAVKTKFKPAVQIS